ncbi:NUDIX hydrolase [Sinosporangium siamense]|uniref:NUDIX hydrolase n=1 Tax=Sinosporangium siamense TaxID=1367973 RepID=UPI00194F47FB|nr:NUDIX domain-containing protein [Sinosporangium siamense]
MTQPTWRPSARILLADPHDRLLLFRVADGTWITPGGGIDKGEPVEVAATRELREETGRHVTTAQLGPVVALTEGHWEGQWNGRLYYSVESYFFLRVPEFTVDTSGFTDYERSDISVHRWWSLTELQDTTERVVPWGLPGLLPRLYAGEVPAAPVRLPWHHPEFGHLEPVRPPSAL